MKKSEEKQKRSVGRPAAFSQEEALDSAVCEFWKHGYDGTDVEQIATALGATKPSIYRQFGNKKTLFVEAMKHYAAKTAGAPREILEQAPTIRQALADLLSFAFENFTRPNEPQGCFLGCIATAMAEDHPEAGKIFLEATAVLEATIAFRLTRAIAEGELPKDFDSKKRAHLLVNLFYAYSLRARAGVPRESLMGLVDDIIADVLR